MRLASPDPLEAAESQSGQAEPRPAGGRGAERGYSGAYIRRSRNGATLLCCVLHSPVINMSTSTQHSITILDDYTSSAFTFGGQAEWDALNVPITRFTSAIPPADLIAALHPFTIVVTMRERASFPADVINALPNLRLLTTTGFRNRAIDIGAAQKRGVVVSGTLVKGNKSTSAVEQTWALILTLARRVVVEHEGVVGGGWQGGVGVGLCGKTLGLVGVGRLGKAVADVSRTKLITGEQADTDELELDGAGWQGVWYASDRLVRAP